MGLQYKVPQNIEIEDTVIGPLTIKQFMYLFVAFMISALLYAITGVRHIVPLLIIHLPVWLIAMGMAFFKPNDRPASVFVYALIAFYFKPRKRVWKRLPSHDIKTNFEIAPPEIKKKEKELPSRIQVQKLAQLLDTTPEKSIAPETLEESLTEREKVVEKQIISEEKYLNKQEIEPTVSQLSSVSPDKKFSYQKIEDLSDDYILKMAYSKQNSANSSDRLI
jgi:hypothetical protein